MLYELGFNRRITWKLVRQFVSAVAVPQLLFYLALWQGPLVAAVGAGGGWTALLQLHTVFRHRFVDPVSLYGLAFTTGQVIVALVAHSAAVYAGSGVAENLIEGLGLLGSIAISRPLLPVVVEWIIWQYTRAVLTLPVRAALTRLTFAWAVGSLVRAVGLYVALTHLPLGAFLLVNTLVGWPLTGVGFLASVAYVRAHVRHAWRVSPGQARVGSSFARCAA